MPKTVSVLRRPAFLQPRRLSRQRAPERSESSVTVVPAATAGPLPLSRPNSRPIQRAERPGAGNSKLQFGQRT